MGDGAAAAGMLPSAERRRPVRPRLAASLILLRDTSRGLEVLMGRRGRGARFMPGRYVFPGGGVAPEDAPAWPGESGNPAGLAAGGARLGLARAALRELFEETGLILGRPAGAGSPDPVGQGSPLAAAYGARGLRPAFDLLTYIARAITPSSSPIRFHAHFFLADGAHAAGAIADTVELEDLAWRPADPDRIAPISDVTHFVLERAVAVWRGAENTVPLYSYVRDKPRIRLRSRE